MVTNITNDHASNWDIVVQSNESSPYGLGYSANITLNYDVSTNLTVVLQRIKYKFRILNATSNETGLTINNFNASVCGTPYTTTTGEINTTWTWDSGLCNITLSSTGYYPRTYSNYNVSTNMSAELFLVVAAPAAATSDLDRSELLLFAFLILLFLGVTLWGISKKSIIVMLVGFIGLFFIIEDAISGTSFASFSEYNALFGRIFGLLLLVILAIVVGISANDT